MIIIFALILILCWNTAHATKEAESIRTKYIFYSWSMPSSMPFVAVVGELVCPRVPVSVVC